MYCFSHPKRLKKYCNRLGYALVLSVVRQFSVSEHGYAGERDASSDTGGLSSTASQKNRHYVLLRVGTRHRLDVGTVWL